MASVTQMARNPTISGSSAATSAPKASSRIPAVSGSSRISPRRLSPRHHAADVEIQRGAARDPHLVGGGVRPASG